MRERTIGAPSAVRSLVVYSVADSAIAERVTAVLSSVQGSHWVESHSLEDEDADVALPLLMRRSGYVFLIISPHAVEYSPLRQWSDPSSSQQVVVDIIVGPTPGWPIRIPRLEIYLQQTDLQRGTPTDGLASLRSWLVAELDPLLVPGISRGAVSLLDGVSRYELRELATACITEEKLLALLFELDMDPRIRGGGTHQMQVVNLLHYLKRDGELRRVIDFLEASCRRCVEHRLAVLRGTRPWDIPPTALIRKLLDDSLPTTEDLDAFCLDHFRDVYQLFQSSMCRLRRTNLLLSAVDPADVLKRIAAVHPKLAAQYHDQLQAAASGASHT